ncbi:CBS domain-containing protein [Amylibacter sp. SFDW26]|uniref:CBS domain-containing protein n=1 Tax=Amylibacter sp. SFDW26 TaxID=2652722 RepID=UPI0012615468|nr:CBS domain-containing protein [Amylibacter sp. SFDW26]KAB7615910.1 CBS domain-containing protein [Amylibacter sp. SFDW26]
MLVQKILDSKPKTTIYTITKDHSISDAAADLSAHRIGVLVVSDDGKTIDGILSERDIIRELGKRGTGCLTESVSKFMTGTVISCGLSDSAQTILETMTEGRFRHMPVIDDKKRLVGLITLGDVVKARLEEVSGENAAMMDMIRGV